VRLVADVHQKVAGLLGCPLPGGMQGDAEDLDASGRVLDHGQDVVGFPAPKRSDLPGVD
jgi:hypothetical protein